MSFSIERAADEQALQEVEHVARKIWNQYFTPLIGQEQVDYMLDKFNTKEALKRLISEQSFEVHKVMWGDELVGYLVFKFYADHLFLSKFYIDSTCRGKGVGRQCFDYLLERVIEKNINRIQLTVYKGNDLAISIYKHFGFEIRQSIVLQIGGGFVMNDYLMEYVI